MRVEAPVLDGDHRLRDIGRHIVQPDGLAAGHAAIGNQLAVDGDDLHVGRTVGDGPGRRARHAGAVIQGEAAGGDTAPDGQDQHPVDEAAKQPRQAAPAPR